ncbi:Tyrocidine synthase I [Slackia heliotrinireducens]|uniref:Amino acid adenylation enzyme/thioester reductase family protein n=1 Tax=Slackia heliotrinireducens (strain ATCC 29202 / DSM 20476 / NCTC 11029 / RHS 1) TaxID=471855 RepID=C7N2R0_SLAHD|nr:amino acid adenylation domain-containing protein [Slackia heliotrinireducens]ACV23568.1 amino acid adenylation enzyme/thioester reductase family protein [Slackia heliotrinireducens DSM 20476]VEH03004.1 Tyrocidine synthase I [Slackia heliotrinireducens]
MELQTAGTIYGMFADQVAARPQATAIIENDRTLTFAELSAMVDDIADGFPSQTRSVGIVMRHCAEMVASILAVLKCGAFYVPAEPSFPIGRIHEMMDEAEVDFVVTQEQYAAKLEGYCKVYSDGPAGADNPTNNGRIYKQDPDALAYILFTSGTTGRPKGVSVTNSNVCHYVRAFAHEFHPGPGDVMLQYSVCSFDIFVEEVFASLLSGAACAIPTDEDKADVTSLMAFVERHGVTMLSGFPYLLAEMNGLPSIPASLRLLISGGDVLRGYHVDNLVDKAEVYNTYGPSETTVCASFFRCRDGQPLEDGTYPIGKAVQGAQIKILDEDGSEVPDGQVGELCIFGGGVSRGYAGDHEEENRAFVQLADGSTMYRSGDLGYLLNSGDIAFLRRKDTQVMIYGKRVEVMEVESRLHQIENVQQAVVRAFTDEKGLSYMIAYVVPGDDGLSASQIRSDLAQNLADFMIPEFIVKMDSIPLNANGKPDLTKLPVVMKVA